MHARTTEAIRNLREPALLAFSGFLLMMSLAAIGEANRVAAEASARHPAAQVAERDDASVAVSEAFDDEWHHIVDHLECGLAPACGDEHLGVFGLGVGEKAMGGSS